MRLRNALTRLHAVIGAPGMDELGLGLALGLLAGGFWGVWRPASFLVPGCVLLWIFLPQRTALIERRDHPRRETE